MIRKPYIKQAERGYHPAEWFGPILLEIVKKDYSEHAKLTRSKKVEGELFPIFVLEGSLDVLRELEYRYDAMVKELFPEMAYDDLKKIKTSDIAQRFLDKK